MCSAISPSTGAEIECMSLKKYKDVWLYLLVKSFEKLNVGRLTLVLPDGNQFVIEGKVQAERQAQLQIHDIRAARMILKNADVGLGESYMKGYWDSPDVTELIELALLNETVIHKAVVGKWFSRSIDFLRCLGNANTKRGSRRNISHHYDLGNDFYQKWLDKSMTYSSALYDAEHNNLRDAQLNKYDFIRSLAGIKSGSSVLEIGCGWGGFAEEVLRLKDTSVVGLTLSDEQLEYAKARVGEIDNSGRADLRLEDYRDHKGCYDAIVSIEMFEAVGQRNWPAYFDAIRRNLKPGGSAVIQVITIAEARFERYRKFPDFIQKYIFPGGFLPTKTAFTQVASTHGFQVKTCKEFGVDYAQTLVEWRKAFNKNWQEIEPLGFDDRFKRMWNFYLQYCEAGFRQKTLDVVIFQIS